jgi:hypothetical protein
MSGVALVQISTLDLSKLLPLGRQALGRSLSEPADSVNSNPPLHHMLCIAALKEPRLRPSPGACVPYLNLFHAGFLIAADERDFAEILEIAGMPCVLTETETRGISTAFVAGTLAQWKTAIIRGCVKTATREARHTYNLIYNEFNKLGLAPIFETRKTPMTGDTTFLLEYKPS